MGPLMEDDHYVVKDPRGYIVSLSKSRYENHIVSESGHTDVPVGDIIKAVEEPVVIFESSQTSKRDVYFGKCSSVHPTLYVKVPVQVNQAKQSGEVVTAFLSKKVSGGINETKGPKYVGYSNKL